MFLIVLIGWPLAEIWLFAEVGSRIGGWSTVGLVVLGAVLGLALVRHQGLGVIRDMESRTRHGETGVREAVSAALLFVAGVLILLPGFFSDFLGFLLLLPPLRNLLAARLSPGSFGFGVFQGHHAAAPPRHANTDAGAAMIIEGEYREVGPENPEDRDPDENPRH